MNFKHVLLLFCLCFVNAIGNSANASSVDYDNACRSYGFNEEKCQEWKEANNAYEQSKSIGSELVYKIRLRDAAIGRMTTIRELKGHILLKPLYRLSFTN